MKLDREMMVQVAYTSVVETVEAFIRFRPGFHGDTGVRDYLYHRLMTGLPDGGTHTRADGGGTLLVQAEWYTVLKYRNTGEGASRGRFDIGVPDPKELDSALPRPLMAFECGRNKRAAVLLGDVDAVAEHEGPAPADITKLAREINYAGLPYGYALEFYDEDRREAEKLTNSMRRWISASLCDRLRVVVLECKGGDKPWLTFLPSSWDERLRLDFGPQLERIEGLTSASIGVVTPRSPRTGESYANRVSREDFLTSSSAQARALIESIEERFEDRVKLVFGGSTMTVNRRPTGKLLRVCKAPSHISDFHPAIGHSLALLLRDSIPHTSYRIGEGNAFRDAVLTGLGNALSA
jgi:hypothetical protein